MTDPDTGTVLSADDAVQYLVADQYDTCDEDERSEVLTRLLDEMFAVAHHDRPPRPGTRWPRSWARSPGAAISSSGRSATVRTPSWTGSASPGRIPDLAAGQDFLSVLTSNANPSKIDTYLSRAVTHDVAWDRDAGRLDATTTIELTNDAPAGCRPTTWSSGTSTDSRPAPTGWCSRSCRR